MRIICPNCDAHYEIEASAIPPGGRDVQCSACGHFWFQVSAHPAASDILDHLPEEEEADAALEGAGEDAGEVDPADLPDLDPAIRALLREEAERETAARRTETEAASDGPAASPVPTLPRAPAAEAEAADDVARPVETVADDAAAEEDMADAAALAEAEDLQFRAIGPDGAPTEDSERGDAAFPPDGAGSGAAAVPATVAARGPGKAGAGEDRDAPSRSEGGAAAAVVPLAAARGRAAAAETGPRDGDRGGDDNGVATADAAAADDALARRRGFRLGFLGVLLLAAGALWLYVYGRGLPDAGPMLTSYVAVMDGWRIALVERLDAVVEVLVQMTVGS